MPIKLSKLSVILLPAAVLTGCNSVTDMFAGEPEPYDGRWVGRLMLSIGEPGCFRRLNISGEVNSGRWSGQVNRGNTSVSYSGKIDAETGKMDRGTIYRKDYGRDGYMIGSFTETEASGTWKDRRCQGKWVLRRVAGN